MSDLLPDGAGSPANDMLPGAAEGDFSFDVNDLRVDFSKEEAETEGRSFENLPKGTYHVRASKVQPKACGPESKNPGKPYYNIDWIIQSGPYEGRHLFDNVMLFSPALYSVSQLMKALGMSVQKGQTRLPNPKEILDKDVNVFVSTQGERTVNGTTYEARNVIKSYMPFDPAQVTSVPTKATRRETQLLP